MTRTRRTILATLAVLTSAIGLQPARSEAAASVPSNVSLDCSFTEPFWTIVISSSGTWFTDMDAPWQRLQVVSNASSPGLRRWGVRHPDGRRGSVTLRPGPGSDGMSLAEYTYEAEVVLGTQTVIGGCNRLPAGSRPAQVVNVADDDMLNVRIKPSASASKVGAAFPRATVWITSTARSGSWIPVAFAERSESGPAPIIKGCANSRFVRRLT